MNEQRPQEEYSRKDPFEEHESQQKVEQKPKGTKRKRAKERAELRAREEEEEEERGEERAQEANASVERNLTESVLPDGASRKEDGAGREESVAGEGRVSQAGDTRGGEVSGLDGDVRRAHDVTGAGGVGDVGGSKQIRQDETRQKKTRKNGGQRTESGAGDRGKGPEDQRGREAEASIPRNITEGVEQDREAQKREDRGGDGASTCDDGKRGSDVIAAGGLQGPGDVMEGSDVRSVDTLNGGEDGGAGDVSAGSDAVSEACDVKGDVAGVHDVSAPSGDAVRAASDDGGPCEPSPLGLRQVSALAADQGEAVGAQGEEGGEDAHGGDDDVEEEYVEEEYVVLDLGEAGALRRALVDGSFSLSGLDTATPVLKLPNAIKLVGEYEETVGTTLLFEETEIAEDSAGGEPRAEGDEGGGATPKQRAKKQVKCVGKTTTRLKFRPMDPPLTSKNFVA